MISLLIGQCERHLTLSLPLIGQISLLLSHITQMITAALLTDKRASPALEIQTRQIAEMSLSLSLSLSKQNNNQPIGTHYRGIFLPQTSFKFTLKKFHCRECSEWFWSVLKRSSHSLKYSQTRTVISAIKLPGIS